MYLYIYNFTFLLKACGLSFSITICCMCFCIPCKDCSGGNCFYNIYILYIIRYDLQYSFYKIHMSRKQCVHEELMVKRMVRKIEKETSREVWVDGEFLSEQDMVDAKFPANLAWRYMMACACLRIT